MSIILESKAGSFRWHENWVVIPETSAESPNGRTHGVVATKDGNICVFNQATPGVLIYSPDGVLLNAWGEYPGAHGLTLVEENGVEYLWLADQNSAAVEKTTLEGEVVQTIAKPSHALYETGKYVPTWVAINETAPDGTGSGDIWVTDGYGSSLVHRFNAKGKYLLTLDGTEGAGRFKCPHGIAFDVRAGKSAPELYVADRGNQRVQVYDAEGKFLRVFGADFLSSPDGFAFWKDYAIVPELEGRVTILDANDNLVAYLGAKDNVRSEAGWPNVNEVAEGKFNSPHGAGADADGNIYVVEWRIGGRIIKLERLA